MRLSHFRSNTGLTPPLRDNTVIRPIFQTVPISFYIGVKATPEHPRRLLPPDTNPTRSSPPQPPLPNLNHCFRTQRPLLDPARCLPIQPALPDRHRESPIAKVRRSFLLRRVSCHVQISRNVCCCARCP